LLNKRQSLKIITRYLLAALANASRRNEQTLQLPLLLSPVVIYLVCKPQHYKSQYKQQSAKINTFRSS